MATAVNAVLVLFLPLIASEMVALVPDNTHSVAIGHLPGYSPGWRQQRASSC